jgi:hypothetical protein
MKRFLACLAVACVVGLASQAQAQFIVRGPEGSIGIRNGAGSYTYIYPSRLRPGANWAQPGTYHNTPFGDVWIGWDGDIHGNLVDPATGDIHLKNSNPASGGSGEASPATGFRPPTRLRFQAAPFGRTRSLPLLRRR